MTRANDHSAEGILGRLLEDVELLQRRLGRVPSPPGAGQLAQPGDFKYSGRTTAPDGWLVRDGASYLRADYPDLFAAIGTTYGSVDALHFNVPNHQGRVMVGLDPAQTEFDTIGETGGAKTHTLTTPEMPAHNHPVRTSDNNYQVASTGSTAAGGAGGDMRRNSTTPDALITTNTGGGGAHNNLQPYAVGLPLIKY